MAFRGFIGFFGLFMVTCGPVLAYGVVVSMFDFHRRDRGSNPGRGGEIS